MLQALHYHDTALVTKGLKYTLRHIFSLKEWQLFGVNLEAHTGKSVNFAIKFDTINARSNYSESVYIDDIIITRYGSVPAKYSAPDITGKAQ